MDKDKACINLSKQQVKPKDVTACKDRFNKAKIVHSVLQHLDERQWYVLEDLYKQIAWPLYQKYTHTFDAFKIVLTSKAKGGNNPLAVLDDPANVANKLWHYIKPCLVPQLVKVRANMEVEMSCLTTVGIDAIRAAFLTGAAVGTEIFPIRLRLIAQPIYMLSTTMLDKDTSITLLQRGIGIVAEEIGGRGEHGGQDGAKGNEPQGKGQAAGHDGVGGIGELGGGGGQAGGGLGTKRRHLDQSL